MDLQVCDSITDIPEAEWDALAAAPVADDGYAPTPFIRWAFLEGLEASGCASPRAGWRPRHLALRKGGKLVAAAPAYAKHGGHGDFVRDWHFADHAARTGVRYYPRLLITVPITPVTGRRLLVAPGEDRGACVRALVESAIALARDEKLSSVHVAFALPSEIAELEAAGLITSDGAQAHWVNRNYKDVADWLARGLDSKKRYLVRQERKKPAAQGIEIRTFRGDELAADRTRWGEEVAGLYDAKIGGMPWAWLNGNFFRRIFQTMPDQLEVVAALRGGRVIAGAFNAADGPRLYGRYWGCHEEHDSLHFNVCLHHSIDDCIARGLQVFEGGAGGEHKLHRGFEVRSTQTAHAFIDPRLDRDLRRYLSTKQIVSME